MAMDQGGIEATIRRKQAENAAQLVRNDYKDKQRELWRKTMGLKVFDLIEFQDLNSGDDIVLAVYSKPDVKDLREGQAVICQAYLLEKGQTRIWFTEAWFKQGSLFDPENEKLIPKLQRGNYTIL